MSITRVTTAKDLEEHRCNCCTEAVKRTLATMLDYNLMKSPTFLIIVAHATFLSLGVFTAYLFIKDRARQAGVPENTSFWLISIIGLANTVGRIVCGLLTNVPGMEYTKFTAICFTIGGCATIMIVHFEGTVAYVVYSIVYGSIVACMPSLRTLIIVETLGLDKLTNSIGLMLIFQGVSSLVGITIAGVLRDATGSYAWSFYFAGTTIIASGLFFIPLQSVAKWEKKKAFSQQ